MLNLGIAELVILLLVLGLPAAVVVVVLVAVRAGRTPQQPGPGLGPPPGWYPDPGGAPVRWYWDGARWTRATGP